MPCNNEPIFSEAKFFRAVKVDSWDCEAGCDDSLDVDGDCCDSLEATFEEFMLNDGMVSWLVPLGSILMWIP